MKNEYARMIYYAYKNLNAYNRLLFIFSAEDFNQAYRRLLYYQQYSAYRRTQAELIRDAQMTIDRKQKELEETRQQKLTLARSEESEKEHLTQEKEEKDKTVQQLSLKEKELESAITGKTESCRKTRTRRLKSSLLPISKLLPKGRRKPITGMQKQK